MPRGRKKSENVHHTEMTPEKRDAIRALIGMYDIKSAQDIQEAQKDLLGGTLKEMLESEMNEHLGYEKYQSSDNHNSRNGYKQKILESSYGQVDVDVPQDRDSTFEPKVVKKRHKDISEIEQKIISMYAKGMTKGQISDTVMYIYGFEVSESFVSDVTDNILPQIQKWQSRPLADIYPLLYIDAIHYSVRNEGMTCKKAAYVIMVISVDGMKEVLSINIGENESA